MSTRQPWFKFYPSLWMADPKLRRCSLESQGLWLAMLCIMHEATPRGELRVGSDPLKDAEALAPVVGKPVDIVATCLAELERFDVFSRRKSGVIVSRRMEKDENLSRIRGESGRKGALATNGKNKGKEVLPRQNSGKGRSIEDPDDPEEQETPPLPPPGGALVLFPELPIEPKAPTRRKPKSTLTVTDEEITILRHLWPTKPNNKRGTPKNVRRKLEAAAREGIPLSAIIHAARVWHPNQDKREGCRYLQGLDPWLNGEVWRDFLPFGAGGAPAPEPEMDPLERRVRGFIERGFWSNPWGPPPTEWNSDGHELWKKLTAGPLSAASR